MLVLLYATRLMNISKILGLLLYSLGCSRNLYSHLTCAIIILKITVCFTAICDNLMVKFMYNCAVLYQPLWLMIHSFTMSQTSMAILLTRNMMLFLCWYICMYCEIDKCSKIKYLSKKYLSFRCPSLYIKLKSLFFLIPCLHSTQLKLSPSN